MKRLGILGGTFNPPHNGHIYIAEQAKAAADLDTVVFIPCGNPPHKAVEGDVAAEVRLEMTRLALEDRADFELCDIEVKSTEKSYTANTLRQLRTRYPDCELCFIAGGDSLNDLEDWYCPEVILSLAEIVAVSRKGLDSSAAREKAELYRKKYNARITLVEVEPMDISSSEIRKSIRMGKCVSPYISDKVLDYIKINGIYKEA